MPSRISIREYADVILAPGGKVMAGREPAVTSQTATISGTSTQSAAFNAATRFIRIHVNATCSLDFGSNPIAVEGECDMAAGQTEYFGVVAGQKVAFISTAD
jgi:hypothetical protein